jgi:hypothetical protein
MFCLLFVLIRQFGFRYSTNENDFPGGGPEFVTENPRTASVATTNGHGLSRKKVAKLGTNPTIPPYL